MSFGPYNDKFLIFVFSFIQIDQTSLAEKLCRNEKDESLSTYNIPYTKLNCEVFANSRIHHNCSLSSYYGVLKSKKTTLKTIFIIAWLNMLQGIFGNAWFPLYFNTYKSKNDVIFFFDKLNLEVSISCK